MSLQQAKRLADAREELDKYSAQIAVLNDGFRKQINDETVSSFLLYMEAQDFKVSRSPEGAEAIYKGLRIGLRLADQAKRYVGVFHSFEILINGKSNVVQVIASISGAQQRPAVAGSDPVGILEQDAQRLKHDLANLKMDSYQFDCAQKGGGARTPPLFKHTIAEVIDAFVGPN